MGPAAARAHKKDPVRVDREDLVPVAKRKLNGRSADRDAGVVDENVEATLALESSLHHRVDARLVGDVGDDRGRMEAARADFRRRALGRFLVEISQNDARASRGQRLRGLAANAAGASRHDRDAAIETHPIPDIHHSHALQRMRRAQGVCAPRVFTWIA